MQAGYTAVFIASMIFAAYLLIRLYLQHSKPPLAKHCTDSRDPRLLDTLPVIDEQIVHKLRPLHPKYRLWADSQPDANPLFIIRHQYALQNENTNQILLDFASPYYINKGLIRKWWRSSHLQSREEEIHRALSAYNKTEYELAIHTLIAQFQAALKEFANDELTAVVAPILDELLGGPINFFTCALAFLVADTIYYLISPHEGVPSDPHEDFAIRYHRELREGREIATSIGITVRDAVYHLRVLEHKFRLWREDFWYFTPLPDLARELTFPGIPGKPKRDRARAKLIHHGAQLLMGGMDEWWDNRHLRPLKSEIKRLKKNIRKGNYRGNTPRLLPLIQEVIKDWLSETHNRKDQKTLVESVTSTFDYLLNAYRGPNAMNVYTCSLLLLLLDAIHDMTMKM